MTGIVFDIQKFCTYDGPGVRTSVFLKGCMMRCPWCHNPESIRPQPQMSFDKNKCANCEKCAAVCDKNVHTFIDGVHKVDFDKCIACGKCAEACAARAIRIFGREMSSDEVVKEVIKDKKYYDASGGGVTVTGGEPTMQFDFLCEILERCRENGISTCVETNGCISSQNLKKLVGLTDLFLLDYKATGEAHKRLTGVEERTVLDSLRLIEQCGGKVILRCPIIPGINDNDEHFEAIKKIKEQHKCILSCEIMAYHSTGVYKWHALGMDYSLENLKTASADMKAQWSRRAGITQ
jgi:glycyl-radical enzyme activating protein